MRDGARRQQHDVRVVLRAQGLDLFQPDVLRQGVCLKERSTAQVGLLLECFILVPAGSASMQGAVAVTSRCEFVAVQQDQR